MQADLYACINGDLVGNLQSVWEFGHTAAPGRTRPAPHCGGMKKSQLQLASLNDHDVQTQAY